jgi:hypothetical protein
VSVTAVELNAGLREGAQVIVSDMARWDGSERIALR